MSTRRIKVVLIIATLERGGAEKQLCMLATHLDRARFDPSVVALTRGGPYQDVLEAHGVRCEVVGKRGAVSPGALARLVRLLRRERPDVAHTWMFTANAYGRVAARLAGVSSVVSEERCVDAWKGPLRLALDWGLALTTDRIVANSPSVAGWLRSVGIPGRLTEIIPGAFDPSGYPARPLDEIAGPGPEPRLAAVGRLFPQKRYDVLLEAMAGVIGVFPQARLTIAGDGPCRGELEMLADRLGLAGNVEMPGETDDVPGLLLKSDLLLMASDYEGMPNAAMEAMCVGVPVVAADAPGTVDLVRDGVTGVLVPRGNGAALAEAALALLGDAERRREIAGRAREYVLAHHSVEGMVRAYERLYLGCARSV